MADNQTHHEILQQIHEHSAEFAEKRGTGLFLVPSFKNGQLETEVHATRDIGYEQCVTWGQKTLAYKWVPCFGLLVLAFCTLTQTAFAGGPIGPQCWFDSQRPTQLQCMNKALLQLAQSYEQCDNDAKKKCVQDCDDAYSTCIKQRNTSSCVASTTCLQNCGCW
jgi:hypothetical protein